MEGSPLSEEQIKRLNEIAKLPVDKQQEELQKFLSTLNKEQIEFLKKRQGMSNECPFCLIKDGKISAKVVYKDDKVMAVLDINPANKGHVLLFPIKHCKNIFDIKEYGWFFEIARKIGKVLIDIGAEGFNFYLANGAIAGQNAEHVLLHIIPRYKEDNIRFYWENKKLSNEEMDDILKKIIDNLKVKEVKIEKKIEKVVIEDFDENRVP